MKLLGFDYKCEECDQKLKIRPEDSVMARRVFYCSHCGVEMISELVFEEVKEESLEDKLYTAYWVEKKERPPEWDEFKEMAQTAKEHLKKEIHKIIDGRMFTSIQEISDVIDKIIDQA